MTTGRYLRIIRIIVAIVSLSLMTGLFVDYGMTFLRIAGWIAKIQFLPATMAFSLATFIIWLIVTLCFGRIYCSTVCPLGVYQDICARLNRLGSIYDTRRAGKSGCILHNQYNAVPARHQLKQSRNAQENPSLYYRNLEIRR